MKAILKFIVLLFIIVNISSFTASNDAVWEKINSMNDVNIYHSTMVCKTNNNNFTYHVFKFQNNSSQVKTITWKLNIWFGENCRTCNLPSPNEYEFTLKLQPGETVVGDCSKLNDKRFVFYKSDNNKKLIPVTKYKLENLTVL